MSPRQSVPIIPAIVEVSSPFEKEFEKEQDKVSIQSVHSRRKSSIFEEIIVSDPPVCLWLLDIISEDEHMIKESAHYILSEHQLIRIAAYSFDLMENQLVLNTEDERCCGKYMHDGTRTLRDITVNNVNILTLDIDKVNLLRDSYQFIFSHQMADADLHSLDVLIKLDEPIFEKANELFDTKADKSDTYTKTETDTLLDAKADKTDTYTKTETDTLLDDNADKTDKIDSSSKIEDDAPLLYVVLVDSRIKDFENNTVTKRQYPKEPNQVFKYEKLRKTKIKFDKKKDLDFISDKEVQNTVVISYHMQLDILNQEG
ncbi:MAG: hypothetical protein EZS28_014486 [Streblomastix strix]|uniref:Uncharacterized protein n=1 Tax=Streblomastix strix TaxID=222440 RepID=A0A5J4W4Z3_9EUKA|nr:MAG: hypothetical protein EZS28_014486 [Streblomastix strix]